MTAGLWLAAVLTILGALTCLWLTETYLRGWWPWPEPQPPESDFTLAWRQMAAAMQDAMIALGTALTPVVTELARNMDHFARSLNTATIRECPRCQEAKRLTGPLGRCALHLDLPSLPPPGYVGRTTPD